MGKPPLGCRSARSITEQAIGLVTLPRMGTGGRRRAAWTVAAACLVLAGCGSAAAGEVVVRGADDVQVLTPEQVAEQRLPTLTDPAASGSTVAPGDTTPGDTAADQTVPQNQDDRPVELRLFDAYAQFRVCIEDAGYQIEGNLADPNNPAYKDPDYAKTVSTCAARSDIVNVLQEMQATRASLTPAEVEQRNKVFVVLKECLERKGWTVETRVSEIGLIEPTVFVNADGQLDERDINSCISEQNLQT